MLLLGINLATTRIIVDTTAYNKDVCTSKPMKKCLLYSILFGMLSCVLLFLFSDLITIYLLHNKVSKLLFYIICITLPFISVSACLNGYFTALRKDSKNATTRFFEQFIKMCATSYLLSLFLPNGLEYTCISLVLGEAISEVLSCLFISLLYFFEKRKHNCILNNNKNFIKAICKISLPVAMTSYIRSGLSSIKQLLIPLRLEKYGMSCEASMSFYGLISGMVIPILMFPEVIINSFSGLLVPEFSYYYTRGDYNKISFVISKIFRITLLFSIGVIGIFLFYSDKISVIIYNNLEISNYLKILCPLLLFMYLDSIVDNILKGLDEQLSVMKCNILDLFVSILCIYFLLPIFGKSGFIFIIFLSELLNSSISIIQLKKITNFKFDFKNWIIKPFLALFFSYIITSFIFCTSCEGIILSILQIVIFYFVFLLISKSLIKISL